MRYDFALIVAKYMFFICITVYFYLKFLPQMAINRKNKVYWFLGLFLCVSKFLVLYFMFLLTCCCIPLSNYLVSCLSYFYAFHSLSLVSFILLIIVIFMGISYTFSNMSDIKCITNSALISKS